MFRSFAISAGALCMALCWGCEKNARNGATSTDEATKTTNPKPTPPRKPAERVKYTSDNNPTTKAGRGQPDLTAHDRPAAWAFVDGFEGEYRNAENGTALMQWWVDGPVSPTPTFRIEVYESLLSNPKDFQCVLQSNSEANPMIYAMRTKEGTFNVGQDYNLLSPGENFTILNKLTNETVKEIPPLLPGQYGLVASIRRSDRDAGGEITSSVEALAVTYFTVGDQK